MARICKFYLSKKSRVQKFQKIFFAFLLSLFFAVSILPVFSQVPTNSNSINPRQLVEKAEQYYQSGKLSQAVQSLQQAVSIFEVQESSEQRNLAISSTNLCRLQLELGQSEAALDNCQKAIRIYTQLSDQIGVTRSKIYQAYAFQKLGFYPRACLTLTEVLGIRAKSCEDLTTEILEKESKVLAGNLDPLLVNAWRTLGELLRGIGKLNEARIVLEKIQQSPSDNDPGTTLLSLGNTLTALGSLEQDRQADAKYNYLPWRCEFNPLSESSLKNYQLALEDYQKSAEISVAKTTETKAQLNRLKLLKEMGDWAKASKLASEINFTDLPDSKFKVYAQINYSKTIACLQQKYPQKNDSSTSLIDTIETAIQEAKEIQDQVAQSYAIGNLGGLYEYLGKLNEAQTKTEEALYLAQEFPYLAYQWQWQLGRIFEAQGNQTKAIINYELAAKTLESVRQDLLLINSDVQFSFRDNIEPLYRQLVALLFKQESQVKPQILEKSLYYIESLQLAELENFLQCNPESFSPDFLNTVESKNDPITTLTKKLEQIHQADPTAALIYPIVLSDRLVVILSLPEQPLYYQTISLPQNKVNDVVKNLRQYLNTPIHNTEVKQLTQQIYQWIIEPLEAKLAESPQLKTLVFILDSSLQNIPMAALYDGKNYLLEKYAVVIQPSLKLLNPQTSLPSRNQISALMVGATDAPSFQQNNLNSLPNVERELDGVNREVTRGIKLIEQEFLQANVQQQINSTPFSILHMATHGNFSSNPEQTYILDWNRPIKVEDLDNLLRLTQQKDSQPIDLLILSACQTAMGDRRAALGLAGVAIRAGARSTLASLWQVNDASTSELMIQFYRNLKNSEITKAESLRRAQLVLLDKKNYPDTDYNRSYYWASFVIVGNWL